jgi:hypothetical protein
MSGDGAAARNIARLLLLRSGCSVAGFALGVIHGHLERRIQSALALHFGYLALRANLARGQISNETSGADVDEAGMNAWRTASALFYFSQQLIETVSNTAFLYRLLAGAEGRHLAPLSMIGATFLRTLPFFSDGWTRFYTQGMRLAVICSLSN